ncbi:ArsR/SmtB family transcription factor [Aquipuribacter sp. MA13-6]|uniref:ArsR/SmtB family transcription factor n=1 Tax=unclassified Aquipuribacter TaxID=2635084 RepID=UPI003EECE1F9
MDAFDGLSDPVRRDLLRRLVAGPARAGDLATGHGISRPAVSRHLRVLAESGLVQARTRGRERWFGLRGGGAAPVQALLDELAHAAPAWERGSGPTEEQLMALDTEVRRTTRDRAAAQSAQTAQTHQPTSTQESA